MIIHRTGYALFYKETDKAQIILDCIRSSGNAAKIYHQIKNGQIEKSYTYQNKQLLTQITTRQDKIKTLNQRNIAKGKSYE